MKRQGFYVLVAVLVLFVAIGYATSLRKTPLEIWAEKAPLEKVKVHPGQTTTELIRERVPEGIRAQGDMTDAIKIIGNRQGGKELGQLANWEEILLPIRYKDWAER